MAIWQSMLLHAVIAVAAVYMTWRVQCRTRNAGIVDISWTLIVGAAGPCYAILGTGHPSMRILLAALSITWALRLAGYLAIRNIGKPEDRRYAELREQWGTQANRSMLKFYLFQAAIAWFIGLSFLPLASTTELPAAIWLLVGVALCVSGIIGEGLADWQLARFKRDPQNKGRVCNAGLWRYSRHPNYFFECLHWCGYPVLAIGAPLAALSLIGPLVIALLLLKVSGIPTVEARNAAAQREGYADYIRRTSAFIPLPPRKG